MKERRVLLADMNSFYATIEQARNPELRGKPVLVCGDPEERRGIVLAASREAKKFGVKTAMTCGEALALCPQALVVRPHMQTYIDVSMQIMEIARSLTDRVEVYSIDELFLETTGTEKLWGDAWEAARLFKKQLLEKLGVTCSIGIGYNKLVAKVCMEARAKKAPEGIWQWKPEDIETEMHPLPVRELFGVGSRMERNFRGMGIRTIGDLAHYPKHYLVKRWGVMGEVYHMSAWGIDHSPVVPTTFHEDMKGAGHSITLHRDYEEAREIETVLLELTEEVCRRLRSMRKAGKTVHVGIRDGDMLAGFYRSASMPVATNATRPVYQTVQKLFRKWWTGSSVRSVGMQVTNLVDDNCVQLDLFHDLERERALSYAMDDIRANYGTLALFRGASLTTAGILTDRAHKIGGHES
jgi:DNA polymerase-4